MEKLIQNIDHKNLILAELLYNIAQIKVRCTGCFSHDAEKCTKIARNVISGFKNTGYSTSLFYDLITKECCIATGKDNSMCVVKISLTINFFTMYL